MRLRAILAGAFSTLVAATPVAATENDSLSAVAPTQRGAFSDMHVCFVRAAQSTLWSYGKGSLSEVVTENFDGETYSLVITTNRNIPNRTITLLHYLPPHDIINVEIVDNVQKIKAVARNPDDRHNGPNPINPYSSGNANTLYLYKQPYEPIDISSAEYPVAKDMGDEASGTIIAYRATIKNSDYCQRPAPT